MKQKHRRVPTCTGWGKSAGDRNWIEVCAIMPERECLKGTQTSSTYTLAVKKVVTHEGERKMGPSLRVGMMSSPESHTLHFKNYTV